MSTTKLFKAGIIATVGVAGLTLAANAQSRYGNVYDYESGRNCGSACTPAPVAPTTSRYGAPVVAAPTYNPAPVYVDCVTAGTCAPQPSVVYTQPAAPVYSQPAPVQSYTQSAQFESVSCPSGTTAQPDGTCLQTGGSSFSTYSEPSYSSSTSSTTFSEPSYSSSTSSTTFSEPVNCPSGTTAQSDGTCMQTGSTFSSGSSFSTGSTYSEPSYSSSSSFGTPANCPAGTTAQSDGTCMQGGSNAFVGSSVELYTGDATTTTPSTGYGSSNTYSSPDYLPIRK